jgi:hypothetical protein
MAFRHPQPKRQVVDRRLQQSDSGAQVPVNVTSRLPLSPSMATTPFRR